MTGVCVRCGAPAVEGHHPTARHQGTYLDPELVVALCRRCHLGVTAATQAWGLDGGRHDPDRTRSLSTVDRTELRLRRLGVTCWWLSTDHRDFWCLLAAALGAWADELAEYRLGGDA